MKIEEFEEISILLGYYKELLSKRQKEYMEKHFEEDYSLTEIAEKNGVSRQAVFENIKRGIKSLREYELKLKVYNRDREIRKALLELKNSKAMENIDLILEKYLWE